ncbi:MAG: S-layer homology domain-containing protein [Clostridia bacterium]|nr:S-layer homology domain-containing protein [Clostridia bacterium]
MKKRRILAVVLAIAILMCIAPTAFAASTAPTSEKLNPDKIAYSNGITLGKQATALSGSNDETNLTLTVTTASSTDPVAVEFVMDGTDSFNDLTDKVYINALADSVRTLFAGRNVYVGITVFGRSAKLVQAMSPLASLPANSTAVMESDITWLLQPESLGTNVQSGIRMGLSDLAAAPAGAEKYMVLVTDGGSYWWLDSTGSAANNTLNGSLLMNSDAAELNYTSFDDLSVLEGKTISAAAQHYTGSGVLAAIKADPSQYTNFETGVYWAAKELDTIPTDVKLVTFGRPYYKGHPELAALTKLAGEFIAKANARSVYSAEMPVDWPLTEAMKGLVTAHDTVLPAGSKIIDVMGKKHSFESENYQFDFVADKPVSVKVTDSIGAVVYSDSGTLGSMSSLTLSEGYVLDYSSGTLTLTMGKPLLAGQTLTLNFTEKLHARSGVDGTHYLLTNYEANLVTPDTVVRPFPEPSVKYVVGTPGPLLNTTDHYSYIIGYPEGDVRPQGNLTRAEAVTIFFRLLTNEARDFYWSTDNPYSDVVLANWYNNAISTITNVNIINGYPDGTFRPDSPITRAEFVKIAVGFFGKINSVYDGRFTDVVKDAWYSAYVQAAYELKLIEGYPDGSFHPNAYITRAEACTVINRTIGRRPHADHLLSEKVMVNWPDNLRGAWYYEAMQEATNSHDYIWITADGRTVDSPAANERIMEQWTEKLPQRDWAALEREWSDSHSAPFEGEVIH